MEKTEFSILAEPWAITLEALEAFARQVQAAGKDFTASFNDEAAGRTKLDIRQGIAVIQVQGSLYRFSYERIRGQVAAAVADSQVRAVVLLIASPGGLVSGCKELGDFIRDAGQKKHIYAYADGTMCSAAYWLGSAARHIAAPVTASVGSIGVRTVHIDWSKWNEQAGLAFTHLAAGAYKALGNEDEPLSDKAKAVYQDRLDRLYSIFVDSVAMNLGVDTDKALAMADGRVFLGEEALEKGLIHRIEQDFESYFSFILHKEKIMDLTTLQTDHKDLYAKVLAQGRADAEEANEQKTKDAVAAETKRVLDLAGAVLGEDASAKFAMVVKSGASADVANSLKEAFGITGTEQEEAEDKSSREKILEGLEKVHSEGVGPANGKEKAGDQSLEDQAKEFADLANE